MEAVPSTLTIKLAAAKAFEFVQLTKDEIQYLLRVQTAEDGAGFTVISADGAITPGAVNMTYIVTKGSAAAITIADPTATTHDGATLTVISSTAFAHTISNAAGSGFNAGGAGTDVGTFGGAKGDNIVFKAYQGKWLVVSKVNVTLA